MNIGPREERKRLVMGMAALAAGLGIAAGLMVIGVDQWWRLSLFFPFWLGALGIFQALEQT
jgi:hypothetical protein